MTVNRPFRVEQIDHVEFFVPDREAAAAWYARVLGLQVVPEVAAWAEDPEGPLMISSGSGTKLALFQGTPQGSQDTAGFHRVAFRVTAEAFRQFVTQVATEMELTDHLGNRVSRHDVVDHGLAHSFYFSDPYGHRLELTCYEPLEHLGPA